MPLSTIDNTGLSQSQILSAINMPTGSIIQTVQYASTSLFTTTSSTYTSTGISASITPLFSTSRILIMMNLTTGNDVGNNTGFAQIYRNGSSLSYTVMDSYNSASSEYMNQSMSYIDSPATTSALTYAIYMMSNNNSSVVRICPNGCISTLILQEIR